MGGWVCKTRRFIFLAGVTAWMAFWFLTDPNSESASTGTAVLGAFLSITFYILFYRCNCQNLEKFRLWSDAGFGLIMLVFGVIGILLPVKAAWVILLVIPFFLFNRYKEIKEFSKTKPAQ